jgi:hypothetical protein
VALPNPKNMLSAAAGDLGLAAMLNPDLSEDNIEKKKKELEAQRNRMGSTGMSVYGGGAAAQALGIVTPAIGVA